MGFRFSKSIRLGKNFRVNISKSGMGISAGVKGFRVSTGPRGSRVTSTIPGTGITHSQHLGQPTSKSASSKPQPAPNKIPAPGLFASRVEKELVKGLNYHLSGEANKALEHYLIIASDEPFAAIMAAIFLAENSASINQSISLLENILNNDLALPTPVMSKYREKYGVVPSIQLQVTTSVQVVIPVDNLGVTLFLVELYQAKGQVEQAINLLEDLSEIGDDSIIKLSLCELYAIKELWDGIISMGQSVRVEDNVSFEIVILYGRALQHRNLHDAAVKIFTDAMRKKKDRSEDLMNECKYWRAISYTETGQKTKANKEFQELYALNPNFRDVKAILGLQK